MLKKVMCCCAFFVCLFVVDSFAASTVRRLSGPLTTSTAVKTETPTVSNNRVSVTQKAGKLQPSQGTLSAGRTSVMPISAINMQKKLKQNINTTSTGATNKPASGGGSNISSEEITNIKDRIEGLEAQVQNGVTDVVESGTGTYVTEVSADGNKLRVEKTRLLYAPVRGVGSENITGDAEIWIVK